MASADTVRFQVRLAKALMKRFEVVPPSPEKVVGRLGEVFQHPIFLKGSQAERESIMHSSSLFFYEDEYAYSWENYLGIELRPLLEGTRVLDLGCFTGGRDAAWFEKYRLQHLTGLEARPVCVEAARRFAAFKRIEADYFVGIGESMPFPKESFDAILTFETFEHVQDLAKVLQECHRVLKPNGKLILVFPGYFHPTSHHLGLVTNCHGIQWFFSGRTLVEAYHDILRERGPAALWYARRTPSLEPWERCNTINGTTVQKLARLIGDGKWRVMLQSMKPVGSVGRNISKNVPVQTVARLLQPLTRVPGVREIVLHRIAYILEKTDG